MRTFGFLSFGHYGGPLTAQQMLRDALDIAIGAEDLGVGGAYFRVHHFTQQAATPFPLLAAIAARTSRLEVGTGVVDMRYENPLHLAEQAAALDLLAEGRLALGISRGSPEPVRRGWEAFGYTGSDDPRGADLARAKFELFLRAVRGEPLAESADGTGRLPIQPLSADLPRHVWWGAGSRETAEWAGAQGVNLMSSTLLTEATGDAFGDLQAEQIQRFREAYRAAGHEGEPRVSVSRSVFPIITEQDRLMYSLRPGSTQDTIGVIDGLHSTFGRTYTGEPDALIEQLRADAAVMEADTLMLTIPSQLGVDLNLAILEGFAEHVAPGLGWEDPRAEHRPENGGCSPDTAEAEDDRPAAAAPPAPQPLHSTPPLETP